MGATPPTKTMAISLKRLALTLISITAGATLYGLLTFGAAVYKAIARRPFDPIQWQTIPPGEVDQRSPMVEDLLESKILLDLTRREVLGLLELPAMTIPQAMRSPQWRYNLGTGFRTVGAKHDWLVIDFGDHGTVTRATVERE